MAYKESAYTVGSDPSVQLKKLYHCPKNANFHQFLCFGGIDILTYVPPTHLKFLHGV